MEGIQLLCLALIPLKLQPLVGHMLPLTLKSLLHLGVVLLSQLWGLLLRHLLIVVLLGILTTWLLICRLHL